MNEHNETYSRQSLERWAYEHHDDWIQTLAKRAFEDHQSEAQEELWHLYKTNYGARF